MGPYCERCQATLLDFDAVKDHLRKPSPCETSVDFLQSRSHSLTLPRFMLLKSRKRVVGEDQLSEEAKRKKVFTILFPDIAR